MIIAGHTRLKAAQKLGLKTVPVICADDLTEEQVKAFRLADNKTAELAEWDTEALEIELAEISEIDMSAFGFDVADLLKGTEEDDFEIEPPEEPETKFGDIWQLGDHRLICGDSTEEETYKSLMALELGDLLLTDPPYNVGLGRSNGHIMRPSEAREIHRRTDGLAILNDDMSDEKFYEFLLRFYKTSFMYIKSGASYYIWHADNEGLNFRRALKDAGVSLRQTLIWNKSSITLGRQDYQWKHEPCLYGWKDGNSHNWYSNRKQATVLEFNKPSRSEHHPTMKPVSLFAYLIQNSTKKNDIVLDPFGGSGTSMIACEQTGRRCRMIELDQKYCDVIVKRWEDLTGRKAEKIEG